MNKKPSFAHPEFFVLMIVALLSVLMFVITENFWYVLTAIAAAIGALVINELRP